MILVCGEALIDLFPGSPEGAQAQALAVAGGSPFNLAIGLGRMGREVGYLGGLSTDPFGVLLASVLEASRVDLALAPRLAAPTPIAVVYTGEGGHPSYAFHSHATAERSIVAADLPATLPPSVRAIALGSYVLAVPPVADALAALVAREGAARVVSLDPNIRPPGLVHGLTAWRARWDALLAHATIVKASAEDLALAWPCENPLAVARGWLELGPRLVVVTDGGAGATALTRHHEVHSAARRVEVVDTVGAGDTFHAALLARLDARGLLDRASIDALDEASLADLLGYAGAAASITCGRRGADLPTAAEIARLHP